MSCCYNNTLKICQPISSCATQFELPYTGLTPGEQYYFKVDFLECGLLSLLTADINGKVSLPLSWANESHTYAGHLEDKTTGNRVTIVDGSEVYDSIQFQTKLIKNVV